MRFVVNKTITNVCCGSCLTGHCSRVNRFWELLQRRGLQDRDISCYDPFVSLYIWGKNYLFCRSPHYGFALFFTYVIIIEF